MAIALGEISKLTTAATALSGLILVTPQNIGIQPQNPNIKNGEIRKTPQSFFFDYNGEETIDLQSEITDHFVEDNTSISDQISLRPEEFKVQGFVGELNDVVPEALEVLKFAAEKLTVISGYTPQLSATALRTYNLAIQAYNTAQVVSNSAVQSWDTINNNNRVNVIDGTETAQELEGLRAKTRNQTKQQVAFQKFYGYWRNRTLFTLQTPWAIFTNMAIKSLRAVQDADTEQVSTFEITFKIMRFAETSTINVFYNNKNMNSRLYNQASDPVSLGSSTPPSSISLLSTLA